MVKIVKFLLYTIAVAGFISCSGNKEGKSDRNMPVPVSITKAKLGKASFYNSYPANIVALKEVELRSGVNGYVTGIFFTEGTKVKAGQELYEIDRRKYQAAYNEAQSNVKIAEDNLEKVQRDADRYTDLAKQDAVAKQLYDNTMTDLKNARQQMDVAKAELIKAQTDYDYSMISAPFNGTIGFSDVKLGALVNSGQTLLNTISSDNPLGVDFEINENELERFIHLQKETVAKHDSTFRVILADNSLYPYPGKLSVIDRAVDPQTGTIKVRVTLSNEDNMLKPGMSCKMEVLNSNNAQQVIIPFKAVTEQLGEYFVYVVENNKANQVKVTLGSRIGSEVVVLKGLNGDENIVVDGIQRLHEGSEITLAAPKGNKTKASK